MDSLEMENSLMRVQLDKLQVIKQSLRDTAGLDSSTFGCSSDWWNTMVDEVDVDIKAMKKLIVYKDSEIRELSNKYLDSSLKPLGTSAEGLLSWAA